MASRFPPLPPPDPRLIPAARSRTGGNGRNIAPYRPRAASPASSDSDRRVTTPQGTPTRASTGRTGGSPARPQPGKHRSGDAPVGVSTATKPAPRKPAPTPPAKKPTPPPVKKPTPPPAVKKPVPKPVTTTPEAAANKATARRAADAQLFQRNRPVDSPPPPPRESAPTGAESGDAQSPEVSSGNSTILKPSKSKTLSPTKRKIFKTFATGWLIVAVISGAGVAGWGYKVWVDASVDKVTDQAYRAGVNDSAADPDVMGVMKMTSQELRDLIVNSPASPMEPDTTVSDYSLTGWTLPGGTEKEGAAQIGFCYGYPDVPASQKGSAYLVSADAQARAPHWVVDSVLLTDEPCG